MALLASLGNYRNIGLLIIRVGLGVMMMYHGYPKLLGSQEQWEAVGSSMKYLGVTFTPAIWGLLAAVTETFGGFLILIGLAFRPVCLFLMFTMAVASTMHLNNGDGLMIASHALELGIVFLGLVFLGPGRFSVDKK
jgi:putative oxidoreductase